MHPSIFLMNIILMLLFSPFVWGHAHSTGDLWLTNNEQNSGIRKDGARWHLSKSGQALEKIRVIVTLRMENFQPEGDLPSPEAIAQQRQRIYDVQTEVLNSLETFSPMKVKRQKFTPKMTVVIDRNALETLRQNPNVIYVEEDTPSPPLAH